MAFQFCPLSRGVSCGCLFFLAVVIAITCISLDRLVKVDPNYAEQYEQSQTEIAKFIFESKVHLHFANSNLKEGNRSLHNKERMIKHAVKHLDLSIEGVREKNTTSCLAVFKSDCTQNMTDKLESCQIHKPAISTATSLEFVKNGTLEYLGRSRQIHKRLSQFEADFENVTEEYERSKSRCKQLSRGSECVASSDQWAYAQLFKVFQLQNRRANLTMDMRQLEEDTKNLTEANINVESWIENKFRKFFTCLGLGVKNIDFLSQFLN